MKPANVMLTLFLVLTVLFIVLLKIRFQDPPKKIVLRRFPSRIEYRQRALCQMDCHRISAGEITILLQTGVIDFARSTLRSVTCPVFIIKGKLPRNILLEVSIRQCGTVAEITDCIVIGQPETCSCTFQFEKPA